MQILKSKEDRLPEFNQFAYSKGSVYAEYSLDRQGKFLNACGDSAKLLDMKTWVASDGATFSSYSELLDYQTDKFVKRYPPHFTVEIRPELTLIYKQQRLWNHEAVRLLMSDYTEFFRFKNKLDRYILTENGFDFQKFEFNPNIKEIERDALKVLLDKFYLDYINNKENNIID